MTIRLPPPARLAGQVLDRDGVAVARALVVARVEPRVVDSYHGARDEGPGLCQYAHADSSGHFAFDSLPPGDLEIAVARPGEAPVLALLARTPGVSVVEVPLPPTGSAEGRVTDAEGNPVAGAVVHASHDLLPVRTAVTGSDGRYRLTELPLGERLAVVVRPPDGWSALRPPDRLAAGLDIADDGTDRHDFVVARAAAVEGTVTREGHLVSGARAAALCLDAESGRWLWGGSARTSGDGRYRIEGLVAGRMAVVATLPDRGSSETTEAFRDLVRDDPATQARCAFDAPAGATTRRDLELSLPAAGEDAPGRRSTEDPARERHVRVRCRVTTADGVPLREPELVVAPTSDEDLRAMWLGLAGPIALDGVHVQDVACFDEDDASLAVMAFDADHDVAVVPIAVPPGTEEVLADVVLQPLPVLRARVVSGGAPVSEAWVFHDGRVAARTGADGTVALRARTGTTRVSVVARGFVRSSAREVAMPHPGVLDLELARERIVDGVVVDESGAPVAGVRVVPLDDGVDVLPAYDAWHFRPLRSVTDANGRFRLSEIGTEALWLRIESADGAGAVATRTLRDVDLAGPLRIVAFPGREIAARVVDPAGRGVPNVQVECSGDEPATDGELDRETRTDASGAFSFRGLGAGRYRLDVLPRLETGFVPARVRVAAGRDDVTVAVEAAGILEGVIVRPDGAPIARADVVATRLDPDERDVPPWDGRELDAWSDNQGRFRILVPPRGRYALAFARNSRAGRDAVLRGGEDVAPGTPLRLVAVPGLSIAGVVVGPNGRGILDAEVTTRSSDGNVRSDKAGGDGRFRLTGFEGGVCDVEVRGPGRVPRLLRGVAAGTTDLRVVLVVGDSITGRLLDAKGDPARGWRVRALRVGEPEVDLWRADVRRNGEFAIQGVDPGEWIIEAIEEG